MAGAVAVALVAIWATSGTEDDATSTTDAATTSATTAPAPTPAPSTEAATTVSPPSTATTISSTTTVPSPVALTQVPGVLTVGHWVAFATLQERDDNGDLIGFEVELVEMLGAALDLRVEWVETDVGGLVDGTAAGTFDIGVGSLVVTESRTQAVDFTVPYFNRQFALIGLPDSVGGPLSFDDLASAGSVGVVDLSNAQEWAQASLEPLGVEVVVFDRPSDAMDAVRAGEIPAIVSAILYPLGAAERLPPFVVSDAIPAGEALAFGVDPARDELRALLDEALTAMFADGTYVQIYDRWYRDRSASVATGG